MEEGAVQPRMESFTTQSGRFWLGAGQGIMSGWWDATGRYIPGVTGFLPYFQGEDCPGVHRDGAVQKGVRVPVFARG